MALLTLVAAPSETVQISVDFPITFDPPVGTSFANGTMGTAAPNGTGAPPGPPSVAMKSWSGRGHRDQRG